MSNPFLSLIFPAHNEESRLPATLKTTAAFLQKQSYDYEVIVVENGRDQIGRQVDVLVTSVLQTSAGRMIFAKVKNGSQGRQNGSQGRQNGSQNRQNSRQSH